MSYHQLIYHIIFRPRRSVPAITLEHEKLLYTYIWGIVKEKNGVLHRIGGMPDHIHMLVQLPPALSLADFMRDVKTAAHRFLKDQKDKFPLFEGWGKSYGAFTCSAIERERIANYIKNQKTHHQTVNFHDELRALLQEYGITVDEVRFLQE